MDVRVGGRYRMRFKTEDGESHEVGGVYKEVVPNERLVFSWAWHSTPERESLVTITLKADGDGTMLTLHHERFFDEKARDGHQRGWTGTLEKLDAICRNRKEESMIMARTATAKRAEKRAEPQARAWSHGNFHWNELRTRDAERAKRFYKDTIGWSFEAMPMADGGTYWVAMLGGKPVAGPVPADVDRSSTTCPRAGCRSWRSTTWTSASPRRSRRAPSW